MNTITRARPPQGVYSVADLARRNGIDPKSARGRLRKHYGGTLSDFGMEEWTYGPESKDLIFSIICPKRAAEPSAVTPKTRAAENIEKSEITGMPTPRAQQSLDLFSWPKRRRSDLTLPVEGGVYALFLRAGSSLPIIEPKDEGLIYIGIGKNLAKRCHFKGKTGGHSPRRSLAALLHAELNLKVRLASNGNFQLELDSERRLDEWMHENLLLSYQEIADFQRAEDELIAHHAPPLNLTKCEQTPEHELVKKLRSKMLGLAREDS